ncbi:cation/H(+) antiporter 15-like [Malania oleifera]|uniref:cation/H(+) antiporter 15-like n=1 Tax=Malania oleifera TaxID=397392 RepID=UPI0025ADFFE6|nr:cation/H(+) antiporter 15-like [Malania oleifera]
MDAGGEFRGLICDPTIGIQSKGVFFGDNPFKFSTPALMSQMSLSSLVIAALQFFLTPLGQSAFVSQIIGGIVLGASFVEGNTLLKKMFFSKKSSYVNQTVSLFGCMLFLFLVGVKTDPSMIRKSGKKAVAIGLSAFFVPLLINTVLVTVLSRCIPMEPALQKSLLVVAALQSVSSYHVIACLLADLKLLNSELGRLAVSTSMVSGTCSWFWVVLVFAVNHGSGNSRHVWMTLCLIAMLILIICILRPILIWIVRHTAQEKPIKEGYIVVVFLMVTGCSFFGEVVGQHFLFGPMLLGLAVPDGPPLGSALVEKLDTYVSNILLPIYFVVSCGRMNLGVIEMKNFGVLQMVGVVGAVGKLIGTIVPSLYYKIPLEDSFCLGLVMSAQGIIEVQVLTRAMLLNMVDEQSYTIMVISMVLTTGTISPILKLLYRPSHRYMTHKKRTIQQSRRDAELRLLACIHHERTTPSLISLLKLSNPTPKTPISFYLVHLLQLSGRSSPLLVAHHPKRRRSSHSSSSDHIVNAFRSFEQQNRGTVTVSPFTAISAYATMHDDVCELAATKRAAMVLVPFHKHYMEEVDTDAAIQSVNRNILRKAPCSVGILVDKTVTSKEDFRSVGVIFLGGADDREVLAYALRMAGNPDVNVTVLRYVMISSKKTSYSSKNVKEKEMDDFMIREFRKQSEGNKRHIYKEEKVKDSVGMVEAIRSAEKSSFDLIMAGRRHTGAESPLLAGITAWEEFPELGVIGDMLRSSDSDCSASVLVVQQQVLAGDRAVPESPKHLMKSSFAVVDIPKDGGGNKVWPVSS